MTQQNPLPEIQSLLLHEYLRERRRGIKLAEEWLAKGMYRREIRALLEPVATGDMTNNLRAEARRVLDKDEARYLSPNPQYTRGAEHMVGARCLNGHPNYFDKREICKGRTRFRKSKEEPKLDVLIVRCLDCGEEMTIEVDCEGYK